MPETEFKGTPGPWKYDEGNSITAEFGDVGICILEPIEKFWCGDVNRHPEGEEYEANARLIAAAPELLAVLEEVIAWADRECMPQRGKHDGPWEAIEAAISKATKE